MTNRRRNKIIGVVKLSVMLVLAGVIVVLVYPTQGPGRQWRIIAMAAFIVIIFAWTIWSTSRPDPELDAIEEDLNRTRAELGQPPIDEKPIPILPIANSKNELAAGILFVVILIGVIVAKFGFDLF